MALFRSDSADGLKSEAAGSSKASSPPKHPPRAATTSSTTLSTPSASHPQSGESDVMIVDEEVGGINRVRDSVEIEADDESEDSEEDVPLAQSYTQSQSQQLNPNPVLSGSTPASPDSSRKRGRPSHGSNSDQQTNDVVAFTEIPQPRYTLIRNSGTKDDPHVLCLLPGVTDGLLSRLPASGTPHINEGTLHSAPDKLIETWCYSVGSRVARLLQLPLSGKNEDVFRLQSLPERYALYQNIKTTDPPRKDPYLWGPPRTNRSVRYRSGPELAPHVFWLLTSPEGGRECACRYCTGRQSQIEINRELGLQDSQVFMRAAYHRVSSHKPNAPRKARRAEPPPVTYIGPFTNALRDQDLAANAPPFRHSEMVWVELRAPLVHPSGNEEYTITHWPAVVCERQLRTRGGHATGALPPAGSAPEFAPVQHRNVYRVQLLGLEDVPTVEEFELVAWLGLSSAGLNNDDFSVPASSGLVFDGQTTLTPRLSHFQGDSQLAMSAFALAITLAANVEYKFATIDPFLPPAEGAGEGSEKPEVPSGVGNASEYQSVWWGAELVHSEELVRVVLPPKSDEAVSRMDLPADFHETGVLFKLSSIFRGHSVNGEVPVVKMAGALVRLEKDGPEEVQVKKEEGGDDEAQRFQQSLPVPPVGYKFRRLTAPGREISLDLEQLAGRWHPMPQRLNGHPDRIQQVLDGFFALRDKADAACAAGEDVEANYTADQLSLVLVGLLPARYKYSQASMWVEDRFRQIISSEADTQENMLTYFERLAIVNADGGEAEEVPME